MEQYLFIENETDKKNKIFFLCGVKFKNKDDDKRKILKKYLTKLSKLNKVVILEENFIFGKSNKKYLAYDEIFMSNLKQVEILAALYSDYVFIIHESNATSAELGMFASNESLIPKIILIVPEEIAIEENKINDFMRLAFFKKDKTKKEGIKKIIFNPALKIWEKSEFKRDYRTYFYNNQIGKNLSNSIMKNIHNINKDKVNIKYSQFNRNIGDEYTLSYYIEDNILYVNIGPQVLRIQILALFNIDEFKRNLRTNKVLKDHISYIEEIYKEILIETIKSKCSKTFNDMKIKIMQNNVNIDIRQAIGYLLYLFQAIKWIALEQIDEDDILRKISISTEFTNICTKYKMFIEKKKNRHLERNLNLNNEILIRYIKKKNKIRKIVSYKSVDCRLRIYHKKVNEFLKQNFINSLFSYAYVENRSIYDNAKAHMYNDFFIMLDIKNFFNNITHEKLIKRLYIEINKKNKNAITLLECAEIVKKCSVSNRGIPLGFVTSPILANIYLKEFDNILYGKLKKLTAENIIYTRYADDLCISFKNNINNEEINEEIIKIVSKLLKRYSLKLNNNKTRNYNINVVNHIKITGINIVVKENGKRTLSVGKKIKNNLFWCAINLYKDKNSNKDYQKQSLRIKGLNSFILSIEKNGYEDCYSEKMKNIIIKLGFENLQDLIKNL